MAQAVWADLTQVIIGTSTERAANTGGQPGTLFYETDTFLTWMLDLTHTWVPYTGPGSSPVVSGGIRRRATLNAVSPGVLAAAGDYTAGDVLNDSASAGHVWIVPNAAAGIGLGGTIEKIVETVSVAGLIPRLRLHFFNGIPTVIQNDNVAFLFDLDDRAAFLGSRDLPALATSGSSEIAWAQTEEPFKFKTLLDANVYFVVQTLDAFTNESAGMTLDLHFTITQGG